MWLVAMAVARGAEIAIAAVVGVAGAQLVTSRWAAARFARRLRSARLARIVGAKPEVERGVPVRFGLMHPGRCLRRWEAECLDQLVALPFVELSILIVPGQAPSVALRSPNWPTRLLSWMGRRGPWEPADGTRYLSDVLELHCRVVPSGAGYCIAPEDVTAIRERKLDFLITFGPGPWSGGVLDAARWGLWAVRYPGQRTPEDIPPGFWEACHEEATTGAALVALSDEPGGDRILKQGIMRTPGESYAGNAAEILSEVSSWPAQVCRELSGGGGSLADAHRLRVRKPEPPPRGRDLLRLVLSMAHERWREFARKNVYGDLWNVGVVDAPIASFLDPDFRPAVRWFPALPPGEFRADPFGLVHEGSLTILCEHFAYRDDRGFIVALDANASAGRVNCRIAMAPAFHLSYPYLIEHDGQIFCVPESHQAGEVALYRADEFPTRWTKAATLLAGVPALDATIFPHGDRWWLTCTMQGPNERSHLYVYHSPGLLGPWTAHLANPVKTDITSARPGGTPFVHQGTLYRPSQDSSRTYGGRVVINRVTTLTPGRFEEECATVVAPFAGSLYPDGVHTLSAAGPVTLLDGKRIVLIPTAIGMGGLRPYLLRRLRHILRTTDEVLDTVGHRLRV